MGIISGSSWYPGNSESVLVKLQREGENSYTAWQLTNKKGWKTFMQAPEEEWVSAVQFLSKGNKVTQRACKAIKPEALLCIRTNVTHKNNCQKKHLRNKINFRDHTKSAFMFQKLMAKSTRTPACLAQNQLNCSLLQSLPPAQTRGAASLQHHWVTHRSCPHPAASCTSQPPTPLLFLTPGVLTSAFFGSPRALVQTSLRVLTKPFPCKRLRCTKTQNGGRNKWNIISHNRCHCNCYVTSERTTRAHTARFSTAWHCWIPTCSSLHFQFF